MSGHLDLAGGRDWHDILLESSDLLRDRFGIAHVTLQPEEPHVAAEVFRGCSLDTPAGHAACLVPGRLAEGVHHGHHH